MVKQIKINPLSSPFNLRGIEGVKRIDEDRINKNSGRT
jgi:hypothetical protein